MVNYRKEGFESAENRWFRQSCGYPPPVRRGHTSLQDGKLQKFAVLQEKTGEKEQNRCFFSNDFDKKVKLSS
jgi:hypothetical protein